MAESGMRVHELVDEAELPLVDGVAVLLTAVAVGQPPPGMHVGTEDDGGAGRAAPVAVGLLADASPDSYWNALVLGWNSVVHLDAPVDEIVAVVRMAASGRAVLPHHVLRTWFAVERQPPPRQRDDERQMLKALAGGATVAHLARELGYSEREMYRRLQRLYDRMGVASRTDALIVASRTGLI